MRTLRRRRTLTSARRGRSLSRRQRTAAMVLAALAAVFVVLDAGGSSLKPAHGGVRGAMGSLYRGTDTVLGPVRRFVQGLPAAGSNDSRVRALQQQNAVLRRQLLSARLDRDTLVQLRRLRLSADAADLRMLPASVIATSASGGFDFTVTIDRGTTDGVRAGQTVTAGDGLAGRVLHSDGDTAVVLLVIDPGSGVGARDLRTGQLGVASGAGRDGYTFRPLDPQADVAVGDRLVTGPARSTSFAPGLLVGTVRTVRVSADGTNVASVAPAVSASSLDVVGVVTSTRRGATTLAGGR